MSAVLPRSFLRELAAAGARAARRRARPIALLLGGLLLAVLAYRLAARGGDAAAVRVRRARWSPPSPWSER